MVLLTLASDSKFIQVCHPYCCSVCMCMYAHKKTFRGLTAWWHAQYVQSPADTENKSTWVNLIIVIVVYLTHTAIQNNYFLLKNIYILTYILKHIWEKWWTNILYFAKKLGLKILYSLLETASASNKKTDILTCHRGNSTVMTESINENSSTPVSHAHEPVCITLSVEPARLNEMQPSLISLVHIRTVLFLL